MTATKLSASQNIIILHHTSSKIGCLSSEEAYIFCFYWTLGVMRTMPAEVTPVNLAERNSADHPAVFF